MLNSAPNILNKCLNGENKLCMRTFSSVKVKYQGNNIWSIENLLIYYIFIDKIIKNMFWIILL